MGTPVGHRDVASWRARLAGYGLLALLVSCGGGSSGEPGDPRDDVAVPAVTVRSSSAAGLQASVAFGHVRFEVVDEGGETWSKVEMPGLVPGGADGSPGVPVLNRLIAVPRGASVRIDEVVPHEIETRTVNLYPRQALRGDFSPDYDLPGEPPPDAETWVAPFVKSADVYASLVPYPANTCTVTPIGSARDLEIALVQVACGRYVPASGRLTLFSSVDVTLSFVGGTGTFLKPISLNPFEDSASPWMGDCLNQGAVLNENTFQPADLFCQGEEFLILTHPEYRPAADRLADWKRSIGILTTVVTVNDGTGGGPDTKEEIKAFIEGHYDSCVVRPSYLLLFGDAEDIETWILPRQYKPGDFATDFPYAQIGTDPMAYELVADLHVGRICVGTIAEAEVVVDKIIDYEETPPVAGLGDAFYKDAAIAGYFQCCDPAPPDGEENYRRFLQDAEEVRDHLMPEGYRVERIYTTVAPDPSTYPNDPTPRYYTDESTLLPAPLRPEDAYPWDGDRFDIIDAFNQGRALFFHIDHGGTTGWSHPQFKTSHLPSLVNGDRLPFVISDNCSSGAFDLTTQGFAESIVRMSGGGAIGALAFTRGSNNGVGRRLLQGVVDALYPDAFGFGDATVRPRLGQILSHVRARIAMGEADPPDYGTWTYVRMISLFGDPTLAVWRDTPHGMPSLFDDFVAGPAIDLGYPLDGAIITALEERAEGWFPVGRAPVIGGQAHLEYVVAPGSPSLLRFFASDLDGRSMEIFQAP